MPSAFLVLGFGSILLAGLLLVSSLRNRGIGEVLDGLTSPNVEGAQETLGASVAPSGGTAAPAENPVGAAAAAGTAVGSRPTTSSKASASAAPPRQASWGTCSRSHR